MTLRIYNPRIIFFVFGKCDVVDYAICSIVLYFLLENRAVLFSCYFFFSVQEEKRKFYTNR